MATKQERKWRFSFLYLLQFLLNKSESCRGGRNSHDSGLGWWSGSQKKLKKLRVREIEREENARYERKSTGKRVTRMKMMTYLGKPFESFISTFDGV